MLETNNWILLNAITYKIHYIEDFDKMRMAVMQQLGYLIDYDSASFYMASPNPERVLEHPIGIAYEVKDMEQYINIFSDVDYSKGLMHSGKNIVYRESDIISDKVRMETEYYKKVYDVQNWHFSLHVNLSFQEEFVGVLSLFRVKGKENFCQDDIFVLEMLKDHLAFRMYQQLQLQKTKKLSVNECVEEFQLTGKEAIVLEAILQGSSNDEICKQQVIAYNTLKKHILSIYKKTGFNSRVQLMMHIIM